MTRKGKEREKVGVEGREYLISKSRVRVSLNAYHRLAAAAVGN
jgi:hypothetical protein